MLKAENLTKVFSEKIAVDNISFQVRPGVVTGLLGPNGAGKSTTMRLLTGFIRPTSGKIFYKNESFLSDPISVKKKMGYLPESAPLYPDMLVSEYLQYVSEIRGIENPEISNKVEEMKNLCELKTHFHVPIGFLSKGFKQRVALAGTLIHNPEVIILDEPTSGLDPNQISQIRALIKNLSKDKTVILSTHILQEVEDICDDVIIINKGKIVANSPVSELHKGHGVVITVRANEEKVKNIFSSLDILEIRKYDDSEENKTDFNSFLILMKNDSYENIFQILANSGVLVREMRIHKKSLESVFKDLTGN
ncbi:MAG: ATP-binding cassette domain-containing protein [Leptospiraceae bacterium]|nr:ATP-binding cassette domain-containing protein [Leptospiraceae bacterium]MCK6380002.1 ATP-binding cassette domain-containing protein [Leptospiraceae bacterium]NUM40155.1 ATP-binding cassette domain-containing protein [Leptospiraceae bacterium]